MLDAEMIMKFNGYFLRYSPFMFTASGCRGQNGLISKKSKSWKWFLAFFSSRKNFSSNLETYLSYFSSYEYSSPNLESEGLKRMHLLAPSILHPTQRSIHPIQSTCSTTVQQSNSTDRFSCSIKSNLSYHEWLRINKCKDTC